LKRLAALGFICLSLCALSQDDKKSEYQIFHYGLGVHVLGSSSVALFNGFEFGLNDRISIQPSISTGLNRNWSPPSIELIFKTRMTYMFKSYVGVTAGMGFEHMFNPWYMANPNSHNFPTNCLKGICPDASQEYFSDLGLTFKLFKNRRLVISPLFTYLFNHNNVVFRHGPTFSAELYYNF
jgi:hypothetical protein